MTKKPRPPPRLFQVFRIITEDIYSLGLALLAGSGGRIVKQQEQARVK